MIYTESALRDVLSGDIVQVAVPGAIHLLTLHPELCTLANQPSTFVGHVMAWSTNTGAWMSVDPAKVVAAIPLGLDLSQRHSLTS